MATKVDRSVYFLNLLRRAQDSGHIRPDVDGDDVFTLVTAVSLVSERMTAMADRHEHLLSVVLDGLAARKTGPDRMAS
ncbi:hypothetical protein [Rhizohabitans arisaemae]|uniref:SbtR family transcriptional regulator n=1 Tax=Rhizohabitans arisaemae TaxID=2720610 RepID=UPI0024B05B13|nr:hypothetical protein [Rhizohabitans arisaemae]